MRHADVRLREDEDVVPESRLQIVLHLREVEVRSEPALHEFVGVVVEVDREVEQGSRYGLVVDSDAGLVKVPSSGSVHAEQISKNRQDI